MGHGGDCALDAKGHAADDRERSARDLAWRRDEVAEEEDDHDPDEHRTKHHRRREAESEEAAARDVAADAVHVGHPECKDRIGSPGLQAAGERSQQVIFFTLGHKSQVSRRGHTCSLSGHRSSLASIGDLLNREPHRDGLGWGGENRCADT